MHESWMLVHKNNDVHRAVDLHMRMNMDVGMHADTCVDRCAEMAVGSNIGA